MNCGGRGDYSLEIGKGLGSGRVVVVKSQLDHEITFDVHRRGQLYTSGYLRFDTIHSSRVPESQVGSAECAAPLREYGGAQYELVLRNEASRAISQSEYSDGLRIEL